MNKIWDQIIVENTMMHWGRFYTWWKGELYALLPRRVQTYIRASNGCVSHTIGSTLTTDKDVILHLTDAYVLQKKIRLPKNSKRMLASAVSLQVERLSPLELGSIYYAWSIEDSDDDALYINIFLVKSSVILFEIDRIEAVGSHVKTIIMPDSKTHLKKCSYLRKQWLQNALITLGAGISWVFLLLSAFSILFYRLDAAIEQREQQVSSLREASQDILSTRNNLRKYYERRQFLNEQMMRFDPLQSIVVLSKAIPKSSWLKSIRIEGDTISLIGEADDAAELALILSQDKAIRDIKLKSVQPLGDKESFDITLVMRKGQYNDPE